MLINFSLFITLIFASIVICGVFFKQDIFERIIFLNTGTSIAGLFICILGTFESSSYYIDVALIYFILSFIATMAYMQYFLDKEEESNND